MPKGTYVRKTKVPTCHPEKAHFALGLCRICYWSRYRKLNYPDKRRLRKQAKCHPERPHCAKGLCKQCWNKQYNAKGPTKSFIYDVKLPKGFYTYLWLREDGTPYYVGKGKGIRGFSKRTHRILPPVELSRIIIQEFETEEDALFAEVFLISFYGREDLNQGRLLNLTDGGEKPPSPLGKKRTPEEIKKSADSRRGSWHHTLEFKQKHSERMKGRIPWNKGLKQSKSKESSCSEKPAS